MTGSAVRVAFPGRIIQYNGIPASKTAINTYMVYSPLCGLDSTRRVYLVDCSHGLFTDFALAYRTFNRFGLSPGSVSPFHGPSCQIAFGMVAAGFVATGLMATSLIATSLVATSLVASGLITTSLVAAGFVTSSLIAPGLVAFGLVTTGLVAFGLVTFGLVTFALVASRLIAFRLIFVTAALVLVSSTGV
ncbi:hypothetical protein K2F33_08185 [Paenibacillus sp. PSB04]|nr:hypothetical protein K2F33_08185 [Paenibacillus sp. PSB04]